MQRFRRMAVVAAMAGALGLLALAGQASAQSYASILSATVVDCSQVTVTGSEWEENADVTITIASGSPTTLGEVETDDEGSFSATFPLNPGLGDGDHLITATSEFSSSSVGVTLTGCAGAQGLLAVTGSDAFRPIAVGVALILAGTVFAVITYRRRSSLNV